MTITTTSGCDLSLQEAGSLESRSGPRLRRPDLSRVEGWLRERFPRHPFICFGVSGATLIHLALKSEQRSTVIAPAYICANLCEAILRTGKRLLLIDAGPQTLHPDILNLEDAIERHGASDTVVLIDHTFGYPFPHFARLRRKFPGLLIIEDSVRALGARIHGQFPGDSSDWILLSMYKTVLGSKAGAVLLTRTPLSTESNRRARATLRERAATVRPLRFVNDLVKRTHPKFTWNRSGLETPGWTLQTGLPNTVCVERFAAELREFESRDALRSTVAEEFRGALGRLPGIGCVEPAPGCRPANNFVSFRMQSAAGRDRMLTELQWRGFFLCNTWPIVPAHYRCFEGLFPAGHAQSEYLSDHLAHIPVVLFHRSELRKRLVRTLGNLTVRCHS